MLARLCKRGEAWCGTAIDYDRVKGAVMCHEPAAVAYRISPSCRWSYACREHYGEQETDKLRDTDQQKGTSP